MSGHNGKSNGSGKHDEEGEKIIHFPSLAERKKKMEWRPNAPGNKTPSVPFFNFGRIPLFTRIIVLSFIIVQLGLLFTPDDLKIKIIYTFGFVPGYFTGAFAPEPIPYGAWVSPLTHIFIHGGWMHLAFNSIMALALGMFFEREFGTRRAVFFFFVCGLAGALFYFILNPFSINPVIGASGSVSGLFGALIMFLGKRGGLGMRTRSPWPIIVFWLAFMVLTGVVAGGTLAWQAHVGGFLTGIFLLHMMQNGRLKI